MPASVSCVKMLNFLDTNDAFVSGMSPSFTLGSGIDLALQNSVLVYVSLLDFVSLIFPVGVNEL